MNPIDKENPKISGMTIQQVSERLKLPKSTIRYWEKEFEGFVRPTRSAGGQRRYSEDDLAALASIYARKKQGLSLAQIRQQLMQGDSLESELNPHDIEELTERITRYVRREIYNFLKPVS